MARILHLEDDSEVRVRFRALMAEEGHEVTTFRSCKKALEAHKQESFDLYVCGQLGKYSDGLAFAADMQQQNEKVLIISDKQKFSKIPYVSVHLLTHRGDYIRERIRMMVTGG